MAPHNIGQAYHLLDLLLPNEIRMARPLWGARTPDKELRHQLEQARPCTKRLLAAAGINTSPDSLGWKDFAEFGWCPDPTLGPVDGGVSEGD